jgi:hypothetical protein
LVAVGVVVIEVEAVAECVGVVDQQQTTLAYPILCLTEA